MMWVTIATAADCQYDFSPCSCSFDEASNTYGITCGDYSSNVGVPMADVAAAFQSKPALELSRLTLYITSEGDNIPADFLSQSRFASAGTLSLHGLSGWSLLRVDLDAFRSSKSFLGALYLYHLDASRMDLSFLTDFVSLTTI